MFRTWPRSQPRTSAPGAHAAEIDVALDIDSTTAPRSSSPATAGRSATPFRTTPAGTVAMVGGTASVFSDVSSSINKDLRLIFPVAALLILMILFVMLRSAVAPLYLLAAVGLEFAGTLGAAVVVFQHAGGQPGWRSHCRSCCSCSSSRSAPTTTC